MPECEAPPTVKAAKAAVKRRVLAAAAAMSSGGINDSINKLLDKRSKLAKVGADCTELDMEMSCWAEIWLRRPK